VNETAQQNTEERKPYIKPQILHELELETRAGSPENVLPDFLLPGK